MGNFTFKTPDGGLVDIEASDPQKAKEAFDKKYKSKGGGKSKAKKKTED